MVKKISGLTVVKSLVKYKIFYVTSIHLLVYSLPSYSLTLIIH